MSAQGPFVTRQDVRTASGRVVLPVYSPEDVAAIDAVADVGRSGQFPFTRGVQGSAPGVGGAWHMEAAAVGASRVDVNARCRQLIAGGATELLVAVQAGLAKAVPVVRPDVVEIDSLDDMLELVDGIDLGAVSLSFDASGAAPVVLALFLAAAQRRGVPWANVKSRVGHDLLADGISPFAACTSAKSAWLSGELLGFCAASAPRVMPVSVGAYRLCEGGVTPVHELSAAISRAVECLDILVASGHDAASLAPRLSFVFGAQGDLFEVVAKCRAARQVWSSILRNRLGVVDDAACAMHLAVRLPALVSVPMDPGADAVRATLQVLAAALGGAATVSTPPAPEGASANGPLRTQQVVAWESGLAGALDPLGGSYYLERLTSDIAAQVMTSLAEILSESRPSTTVEVGQLVATLVARAHGGATVAEMCGELTGLDPLAQPGGRHTGT